MSTDSGTSRMKSNSNHITDLPDCIISHILSRLPMLDAVRTSILAKDWEHKWTSIYKIDLNDYKPCKSKNAEATFVNFVERTLRLSHHFQTFRLSCAKKYKSSDIQRWISTALARDLHSLEIHYGEAAVVFPTPNLVKKCNSLGKLELNLPCTFKVHAKICFPHLTALRLERVKILNELPNNSDTMMFDFPVLETLEIIKCKWLNAKCVQIYAPKRTTFRYEAPAGARVNDFLIKITKDGFVKFESCDRFLGDIFLSGGLEVVDAYLGGISESEDTYTLEKSGLQIRKQLKRLLSLKDLHLLGGASEAIALSKLGLPLPMFSFMQRLYMQGSGNAKALFELLHAAPCLKILDIDVMSWNDYDYDAEQNVPLCVVSHLEIFRLRYFIGTTAQFKLAKFLLKNASQLKKFCFNVFHYHCMSRNEIKRELSRYPKASARLTMSITTYFTGYD